MRFGNFEFSKTLLHWIKESWWLISLLGTPLKGFPEHIVQSFLKDVPSFSFP